MEKYQGTLHGGGHDMRLQYPPPVGGDNRYFTSLFRKCWDARSIFVWILSTITPHRQVSVASARVVASRWDMAGENPIISLRLGIIWTHGLCPFGYDMH